MDVVEACQNTCPEGETRVGAAPFQLFFYTIVHSYARQCICPSSTHVTALHDIQHFASQLQQTSG